MEQLVKKQIISIIDDCDDMTIATIRKDGFPQANTVSYVNDGLAIYMGTSSESAKSKNIARNERVSLTINRPYDTWAEIEGISLGGRARLVTDPKEAGPVVEQMMRKFPQIPDFFPTELVELALIRIDPIVISLLDYRKGFGHADLVRV